MVSSVLKCEDFGKLSPERKVHIALCFSPLPQKTRSCTIPGMYVFSVKLEENPYIKATAYQYKKYIA